MVKATSNVYCLNDVNSDNTDSGDTDSRDMDDNTDR